MKTLRKVLVLGAGALKIGQSGEFDYSGSQALKALREDHIFSIVVNPNIATIQTSKRLADQVYFVPVTCSFVEKIIEREQPDGILLSFGGQTALNCGIELFHKGILHKHQVAILGTPIATILLTEDRQAFARHVRSLDIPTPRSRSAHTLEEAMTSGREMGFPVMVRSGFALGGLGSGIATTAQELERIVEKALVFAPQVLIEQYLHHYKEVEYEVIRDRHNNCIAVCNMENMDPLGIHTGESVVVAPSQTLTNTEYHTLRAAAIALVRSLDIIGECNVQFAVDPGTSAYYVIEVNARLSRSSALASKATGYPLAYVAAKLALGYGLTDLTNHVTGVTSACFEPSLDYVVVKIPRWDFAKFTGVDETIGTSMQSVGEVMGIGRTFEEAYQKAIRMLDLGFEGATADNAFADGKTTADILPGYLSIPTPKRIFALAIAMRTRYSIEKIASLTGIDPWFLERIQCIVNMERALQADQDLSTPRLLALKQVGMSDKRIGELTGKSALEIRALRKQLGVTPCVFQIDTLAAEFFSNTNYLYMTYNGQHHDVVRLGDAGVVILGSGPYRIGSSVEFDWTSVSAGEALKKYGKRAIVINCNPETVSTDYDISDRLYFQELTFEGIADICEFEDPHGVIVSVGGQTPNNQAKALQDYGIRLLGTDARHIDQAEDRSTFSRLLDTLGILQPEWDSFVNIKTLTSFAERVGYPVLVRPSYVLSGSAMHVCSGPGELEQYAKMAATLSPEHPIAVSKFFEGAREIELDGVAQHGEIKVCIISEHIENAGVHSGDATIVLPPQTLNEQITGRIEEVSRAIARVLAITGPFNVQFLVKDHQVYVIEVNLRASRTFPFISKVVGVNFIETFVDALFQEETATITIPPFNFTAVKAPQFSFSRLAGADPMLGVEMASTGEVACFGEDLEEAYLQAMQATGGWVPQKGILISIEGAQKQTAFLESARQVATLGVPLYATEKTYAYLQAHGIDATLLSQPDDQRAPNVLTAFHDGSIDLAIIVVDRRVKKEVDHASTIRRSAIDCNIPLLTRIKQVRLFVRAIVKKNLATIPVKSWNEYS